MTVVDVTVTAIVSAHVAVINKSVVAAIAVTVVVSYVIFAAVAAVGCCCFT